MTPSPIDYLLSRVRRRPAATLEARAESRLLAGAAAVPRAVEMFGPEYDPVLASFESPTAGKIALTPTLFLRPWLGRRVELRSRRQIVFGRNAIVRSGTILNGRSRSHAHGIRCGDDFYVKENAYIDAYGGWVRVGRGGVLAQATVVHGNGGVTVGDYLMMGHGSMILAGNHNHWLIDRPFMFQGSTSRGIVIGNNVWIGAGAIILDGSRVGDNVVVGAGTVITGDVPSNSLVIGQRELSVRPLGRN